MRLVDMLKYYKQILIYQTCLTSIMMLECLLYD